MVKQMKKILVIDDDSYICNLLVNYLKQKGYQSEGTISGIKGLELIKSEKFDLILCDYRLPDSDGLEMLGHIKNINPSIPVIIMTAYADIKTAVLLIKAGAYDYVTKPIQHEEILQIVNRAIESKDKKTKLNNSFGTDFVEGRSEQLKEVIQHVQIVAPTEIPVLIEGETGSGKEYIARAIHAASNRKNKPFVAVDCGAIPRELASSELFGHIKGAFTGATNDRKGFFELAKGGTLFLDEVGNLPHENQMKLLRALQEKVISKVGDNKPVKVDVRLITATNEDLLQHLTENEFREDLYHRLNGFKIYIPPLRERPEDIFEFAGFFITKANKAFDKNILGLDDAVKHIFKQYHWFGNIRELQNVINRAVLLSQSNYIKPDVLPDEIKTGNYQLTEAKNNHIHSFTELKDATETTERTVIANALSKCNYNKSKAAKILNIDRKTLYNKIKLYNIDVIK